MLDVNHLIQSGGLLLIALIVFAESGLLIGFFLPGDTLLLSAGIFASQGKLPLIPTIVAIVVANILGNEVGYYIGKKTGHRIFRKTDGLFFRQEYIQRSEEFYKNHGSKTIFLARFVPVVRTLAAMIAGIGKMRRAQFIFFNILGGIVWGAGVTLIGYYFGSRISNIDHYILPIFLFVTLASIGSPLLHVLKDKKSRQQLLIKLKSIFTKQR